jgi:hypothetical protein
VLQNKDPLLERIEAAKALLASAEAELEKALAVTAVAPRAAKVIIGTSLEAAFHKLKEAKGDLGELEQIIINEDI